MIDDAKVIRGVLDVLRDGHSFNDVQTAQSLLAIEYFKSALSEAGYVIVPREPTQEMIEQSQQAFIKGKGRIREMWDAMIEAAPK